MISLPTVLAGLCWGPRENSVHSVLCTRERLSLPRAAVSRGTSCCPAPGIWLLLILCHPGQAWEPSREMFFYPRAAHVCWKVLSSLCLTPGRTCGSSLSSSWWGPQVIRLQRDCPPSPSFQLPCRSGWQALTSTGLLPFPAGSWGLIRGTSSLSAPTQLPEQGPSQARGSCTTEAPEMSCVQALT